MKTGFIATVPNPPSAPANATVILQVPRLDLSFNAHLGPCATYQIEITTGKHKGIQPPGYCCVGTPWVVPLEKVSTLQDHNPYC